jgi:tRNA-2-methylthio-N6-dimethylallyladenosine synthase
MSIDVIDTMAKYDNICNYIHLPVQSGSDTILKKMNRQHSRKEYFELVDKIRKKIPSCAISHDMIAGFPSETEQDHHDTLSLMEYVKYDFGFMFAYSERPGTLAAKKIVDDIPKSTKKRRLQEIIDLQRVHSEYRTQQFVGKTVCVLIEKSSKRSSEFWSGRTSQNTVAVFLKEKYKVGDFVDVKIDEVTSATLIGTAMGLSSSI